MRSLSDTLERLARFRAHKTAPPGQPGRLQDLRDFGSNPGRLTGKVHVPSNRAERPALVVVLHGCTQTASGYDHSAGWSALADQHGFIVLLPEQTRENNGNLCFNWFVPGDIRRDQGEARSIRQMIDAVVSKYTVDPSRIFITGLSAGGAMANVMLSTYPEVFAAGAVIAGLPYGVASTVPAAFDRMRGHGLPEIKTLQSKLKAASPQNGPWPVVSVWHGSQDNTVAEINARAIVDQWRGVHGVGPRPDFHEPIGAHSKAVWKNPEGREVIEYFSISGMGHGTPIDASSEFENAAPYMLDIGISSTICSAKRWGLLRDDFEPARRASGPAPHREAPFAQGTRGADGIQQVIEDALRKAGLMR